MADVYDKVMELAKRRGFVWPSSEIYGSVAGLIDYGPLGAMMKRKIENLWRDYYVAREGYFEIECPTVGEEAIYIASGHERVLPTRWCSARTVRNTTVPTMSARHTISSMPRPRRSAS
jgi:Glycyl-tRNA synthetase (class II)